MNIGIIVYSQTGNTFSVAQKLQEKLHASGHTVTVERIGPVGEERLRTGDVLIEELPDISQYDALVYGSPVQGFTLAPAMKGCLKQFPPFEGKKVACLVTMMFPYSWLGGTRAIRQMRSLCQEKGGTVQGTAIINWASKNRREQQIADTVNRFADIF